MKTHKHIQPFILTAIFLLALLAIPSDGLSQAFKEPTRSLLGTWEGEVELLAIEDVSRAFDDFFDVPPAQPILLTGGVVMSISFHEGNFFAGTMEMPGREFEKDEVILSPSFVETIQFDVIGTVIGKKIRISSVGSLDHIMVAKFIGDSQMRIEFDLETDICVKGRMFCDTAFIAALGVLTRQ